MICQNMFGEGKMLDAIGYMGSNVAIIPENKTCKNCTPGKKSNFDNMLSSHSNKTSSATANTNISMSMPKKAQADAADEAAATKEMLALMKMLMSGRSTTAF